MKKTLALALLLAAGAANAQSNPNFLLYRQINRYYDASNAISASQLLGVPMPLSRGGAGDWRLALAPAYIRVSADPLKFHGASLNGGFHRLLGGGWGVYAVALSNYARTSATSDAGAPNDRMVENFGCLNCDQAASYSGTQASGGAILTFAESAGLSYTAFRGTKSPVTFFGGPVFTQSYARNLSYTYSFSGTFNGGNPYNLTGTVKNRLNAYFTGLVAGAAAEYPVSEHFRIAPHIYEVVLLRSSQSGSYDVTEVNACAGCTTTAGHSDITGGIGTIYFPIPGCDIIYRDWGLSFNLIEPFGGLIAKTTADMFLHGAWPFSLRLTWNFGNYEK